MTTRTLLNVLGLVLIIPLLPATAWPRETVIVASTVGECELRVEANDQWHTLRLRAHHPGYKGCHIDRESMLSILGAAFSKTGSPKLEGSYSSLFLGRLIDYPWMSQYLANGAHGDRGWSSVKGKPVAMDINKYVSNLLSAKELMEPIETVLAKGGYRVVGVTVEKVLVGGFREVPLYQGKMSRGRVPYDAQVWLRLEKD
jgi:hypothetical protein